MAEVRTFRGVRYAPSAGPLQSLICPPYDVIPADLARRLLARSPFNAVRVELPTAEGAEDAYERSARTLRTWLADGVLAPDPKPALYALSQQFVGPDGRQRTRTGFLARVRLEGLGSGVRPHERTHAAAKADRLALLRATCANLSPIFMLYSDPAGEVAEQLRAGRRRVGSASDDDGTRIEFAVVDGPEAERICALLSERSLLIADGHHRYTTALAYRDERRAAGDASADFMLTYLCSMQEPGLEIFPTHRLIKNVVEPDPDELLERLQSSFELEARTTADEAALNELMAQVSGPRERPAFVLVLPAQRIALLVRLREGGTRHEALADVAPELADLPVNVLHRLLLPLAVGVGPDSGETYVEYEPRAPQALARLHGGSFALGAFMAAPTVEEVDRVSLAGLVMPQKTTYFYPKVPSGLVFSLLNEPS